MISPSTAFGHTLPASIWVLFEAWVNSSERYWVTSRERQSYNDESTIPACNGLQSAEVAYASSKLAL